MRQWDFNPRTRVGCDGNRKKTEYIFSNFNPRTRVGCDETWKDQKSGCGISIHAPAWGATKKHDPMVTCWFISIHAPAWGATLITARRDCGSFYFNPRTRVGCDDKLSRVDPNQEISIHAPAWGATFFPETFRPKSFNFNPRTRVGCDMQWPGFV